MTDYQTETAFSLSVTAGEAALVAEAVTLSEWLIAAKPDEALPSLSPAFAALFPPRPAGEGDAYSGFRQLFCDGEYPDFGCEIEGETGEGAMIRFAGSQVDTDAIAELIRRCCVSALPLRFGWAATCSKYRDNAFGGGTIEITQFDIRDIINPDLENPLLVLTTSGRDGETLFWNEDAGFGPLAAATVYTACEAERVTVVAADAPEWMSLPRRVPPVHLA